MSQPTSQPANAAGPEVVFDYEHQRDAVRGTLLDGETLVAVLDASGKGTGFMGLTDRRVIVQDHSLVGGKVALLSIPYDKVTSVGFVSDSNLGLDFASSSTITLTVSGAGSHEVSFRGADKARYAHDTILWHLVNG